MFDRALRALSVIVLGCFVAACASLGGYPENPTTVANDLDPLMLYFSPAVLADYQSEKDPVQRAAKRNEIVYGRMAAYDIEYSQFQHDVNAQAGLTDTAGDLTTLTLTAIGATGVATGTKTAVSAAATAVTGAKSSIDKNIFYDKTIPALFAQMEANRTTVRATIITGLGKTDAIYPLGAALSDLAGYRDAGSLPGAVAGVAANAGDQKAAMQQLIINTRGF